MSDPSSPTPNDFTAPETFTLADARGHIWQTLGATGCMLLLAAALLWFLLAALLSALDVPFARGLALLLALVFIGAMLYVRYRQLAGQYARSSITVSPQGLYQTDAYTTVTMAWPDIVTVAPVRPWKGAKGKPIAGTAMSKAVTQATVSGLQNVSAALLSGPGLVGRGHLEITTKTGMIRRGIESELGKDGRDPHTGEAYVAITPGLVVAKDWSVTRFGEWLRHYRPDLWEPAHQELRKIFRDGETPSA